MRTVRTYPTLLALAISLVTYAGRPATAEAQSRLATGVSLPPDRQAPANAQAELETLRKPISGEELQTFSSNLGTLLRVLHRLNANRPDVQGRLVHAQQQLTTLTPEQWTALANSWDRNALSQSADRLNSLMGSSAATPEAGVATPESLAATLKPAVAAANDISSTNTVSVANYGICAPSAAPSFLGADSIPSTTSTDYGLFIALQTANAALIPLAVLCDDFTEILGEGTNAEGCIPYGIASAIAFALQVSLQADEFCDSNILSAENDAAYFNTIAIFNNLANDTSIIQSQITGVQSDLDTHIASVDSDLNAHITSIDSDIDNHVAAINLNVNTSVATANSNLNAQITAIDADIDGRVTAVNANLTSVNAGLGNQLTGIDNDIDTRIAGVNTNTSGNITAVDKDVDLQIAAANMDIDTRVANADTDLNTHLTAVDTDLNTHLSAVDADVLSQGSNNGTEIATAQALNLRLEIEQSLAAGVSIAAFETPKAEGSYLELVGTIVQTAITGLVAAGQGVGNAQAYENQGNTAFAAKQYVTAYFDYVKAYQTAAR